MIEVSKHFRVNHPNVISEVLDGEAIMVNLETGAYYSLRGVGTQIWEAVTAGATCDEVTATLIAQYSGEPSAIRSAVEGLIDELAHEGLIIAITETNGAESSRLPNASSAGAQSPFEAPLLQRYTDMAELLLLDPIHEVDQVGWPAPKGR
jgi:coenzyme PQQ synthesis protein D (PqqD)